MLYSRLVSFKQSAMRNSHGALLVAGLAALGLWNLGAAVGNAQESGRTAPAVRRPQVPVAVQKWQTDEGLPQRTVTSIAQTRDGYLWLGTLNGLVRFDGVGFTVFDESNVPELRSSRVVKLFVDREGDLWVGTETGGVVRIHQGEVLPTGIGQDASSQFLASACQDAQGAVWLYTTDGQLWRYRSDRFDVFTFGLGRASNLRIVAPSESGSVWVGDDRALAALGADPAPGPLEHQAQENVAVNKLDFLLPSTSGSGGIWRLADGRVRKFSRGQLERDLGPYPWSRLPVSAACEDAQGSLLVGTLGGGLFGFNADGSAWQLTRADGLSDDIVLALCTDREGNVWVGTDGGGLNRVKRQLFDVVDERSGLAGRVIESICEDPEGGVWVGSNGGGVTRWNPGHWRRYSLSQGLTNTHVWAVCLDRERRLWAGTWGGGVFWLQNDGFQPVPGSQDLNRAVLALHQDRAGRMWLGTLGGLAKWESGQWRVYTTRDGLSSDEVRAIADDAEGNLWVGTRRGGLNRFRDGVFTAFHKKDGVPSEDISSLLVDSEGVLWIGTFGSGLGRFHQGRFTRYTTREGLASNSVGHLLEDGQGFLWLGSNAGLMRIARQQLNDLARGLRGLLEVRKYTRPDGLPTRECTIGSQPGACRTRDGRLWFPTVEGIGTVHPGQLNPNPHPPQVVIESVVVDGKPQSTNGIRITLPGTLTVPPGHERIEFVFTSLGFSAPDRARFRYRLERYENTWVEAGASRSAGYSRVPPGHYLFHVIACNEDGVWSKSGASLAVVVERPLWRRWWFISSFALVLLAVIIAVVHYLSTQKLHRQLEMARHAEALERERARIARDIHDQLGANLTQIALLSELAQEDKDKPDEIEAHGRQIWQTARNMTRTLDEIVWAVNPSNDTLDSLVTYACKYAQEYFSIANIRCRVDVPADLPAVPLPPDVRHNVFLALKEAVTNVVRHSGGSVAWLRLRLTDSGFVFEIEDNGRGMADKTAAALQSRNGLRNMRQRLESIGGGFAIDPAPGGGTLVRLQGPLDLRRTAAY